MTHSVPRARFDEFGNVALDLAPWTWLVHVSCEFLRFARWGATLPSGYGIAWYDLDTDVAVCMPVPLNAIVGGARAAWRWLRFPPWRRGTYRDECVRRVAHANNVAQGAYFLGYHAGYNACLRDLDESARKLSPHNMDARTH